MPENENPETAPEETHEVAPASGYAEALAAINDILAQIVAKLDAVLTSRKSVPAPGPIEEKETRNIFDI